MFLVAFSKCEHPLGLGEERSCSKGAEGSSRGGQGTRSSQIKNSPSLSPLCYEKLCQGRGGRQQGLGNPEARFLAFGWISCLEGLMILLCKGGSPAEHYHPFRSKTSSPKTQSRECAQGLKTLLTL